MLVAQQQLQRHVKFGEALKCALNIKYINILMLPEAMTETAFGVYDTIRHGGNIDESNRRAKKANRINGAPIPKWIQLLEMGCIGNFS
jgi:hypothetical protein